MRSTIIPKPAARQSGPRLTVCRVMPDGTMVSSQVDGPHVTVDTSEPGRSLTVIVEGYPQPEFVDALHRIGDGVEHNEIPGPCDYLALLDDAGAA